jgi:hypothetical protein
MDENFNQKIISDFGLGNLDSREQERMIEKIGNLLFESVVERSVDLMDEETINNFDEAISNAGSNYEQVLSFLKGNVSGFEKIVTEEMARLKRAVSGIFA